MDYKRIDSSEILWYYKRNVVFLMSESVKTVTLNGLA